MNYNPQSFVGFVVIFCFLFFLIMYCYFLISLVSFLSWRDVILFFLKEHFLKKYVSLKTFFL